MIILRFIDGINEWLGRAVALLLLPSIAIALYEVVMRYFFNAPTIWVNESILILFGFYFLLGGSYTLRHDGHVRVDVLTRLLSPRASRILNIFAMVVAIFFLAAMFWISGRQAMIGIQYMERADSAWRPYIFPVLTAAPVAAALMILQALAQIVRDIFDLNDPSQEEDMIV